MRRSTAILGILAVLSLLCGPLFLAACHSSPINGAALVPASQADVETLFADAATDRAYTKGAIEATSTAVKALRDDLGATGAQVGKSSEAITGLDKRTKDLAAREDEIAARPPSGGIPGALVNTLGGSLPPWLDWLVTLGATALGINTTRNASRKKALAKVAAPKPPTPTV